MPIRCPRGKVDLLREVKPGGAMYAARIYNAGWSVRNQRNNAAGIERRRQALDVMAGAVRAGLDSQADPEPILYAVALALHDRREPRFQV